MLKVIQNNGKNKESNIIMARSSTTFKKGHKGMGTPDGYRVVSQKLKGRKKPRADHIKPFALFPELRFAIDNGRTLCDECHKTTETYGININKTLIKNK